MEVHQHEAEPLGLSLINRLLYWCAVGSLIALGIWIVNREVPNPHFEQAMRLRGQLALLEEHDRDKREDLLFELRRVLDDLDQQSRNHVMKAMQIDSLLRRQRTIDRFFDLPHKEQMAELDRRIDDMEARRLSWEQRQREAEAEQSEDGQEADEPTMRAVKSDADDRPTTAEAHRSRRADDSLSNRADPVATEPPLPAANSAEPRVTIPPYPGSRYSSEHLSPDQRQHREDFYRLLQERRLQRGLPPYWPQRGP